MKSIIESALEWVTKSTGFYLLVPFPEKEAQEFVKAMEGKYDCEIKKHREQRSLNANAYFHVLVNKMADALQTSESEVKVNLVLEYGSVMRDENGEKVGFKLPESVNVNDIYKYAKWFDLREENGKKFNCFIVYEHTHKYDTKQMARLIDGTVSEAKELGIETKTPDEIRRLVAAWEGSKK